MLEDRPGYVWAVKWQPKILVRAVSLQFPLSFVFSLPKTDHLWKTKAGVDYKHLKDKHGYL